MTVLSKYWLYYKTRVATQVRAYLIRLCIHYFTVLNTVAERCKNRRVLDYANARMRGTDPDGGLDVYVCCYSVLSCINRSLAVITQKFYPVFKIRLFRIKSESEEARGPNPGKIKALFSLLSQYLNKSKLMRSSCCLCVYALIVYR
jgi:hypothetical protein